MFTDMDWWTKIRLEVLRGERSKREILRREGIHWETLKKILEHSEPPGYRMKRSRPKPKIGPYLERIAQIIEEDKALPKKQRHTAKRIYVEGRLFIYQPGVTLLLRDPLRFYSALQILAVVLNHFSDMPDDTPGREMSLKYQPINVKLISYKGSRSLTIMNPIMYNARKFCVKDPFCLMC